MTMKNNLVSSSTISKHLRKHLLTQASPDQKTQMQIDNVLVTKMRQRCRQTLELLCLTQRSTENKKMH